MITLLKASCMFFWNVGKIKVYILIPQPERKDDDKLHVWNIQLKNSEFKLNNAAINVTFLLKLPLFSNKCISFSIWVISRYLIQIGFCVNDTGFILKPFRKPSFLCLINAYKSLIFV